MEFLRLCAARLDAGEPAEDVLVTMRARYTTPRTMNVKVCLVRQLCKPSAEFLAAREALLAGTATDAALHAELLACLSDDSRQATSASRSASAGARASMRELPRRIPANARALALGRADKRDCKRESARSVIEKNRCVRRVRGVELLCVARAHVARPEDVHTVSLMLSLLMLSGRRTCELLNGTSSFTVAGPHAIAFGGQAKKRGEHAAAPMVVPVLCEAAALVRAVGVLRGRQDGRIRDNAATSARYQSELGRGLRADPLWAECGNVHALRGVYACMALRLFEWGDFSHAYVAMCILGHAGLHESLVYTPFDLGRDFADGFATLGDGMLTESRVPVLTPVDPPNAPPNAPLTDACGVDDDDAPPPNTLPQRQGGHQTQPNPSNPPTKP